MVFDTLEAVCHDDGRVRVEGNDFFYEYKLKDHLGNTRVVFEDSNGDGQIQASEVKSRHDYYAFGMEQFRPPGSTSGPDSYRYLYNGKELLREMEIGLYHYGARQMDPVLGRFWQVDPLADIYAPLNPYNYVANNPLRFIDPTGMYITDTERKFLRELGSLNTIFNSSADWIDHEDGSYTAEDGDSAWTLSQQTGISYERAKEIMAQQGMPSYIDPLDEIEKSAVDPGDVVYIPEKSQEHIDKLVKLKAQYKKNKRTRKNCCSITKVN
jgi:RHS repeat-associated protein